MSVVPGTGIITPALTLLGIVSQGETPSATETADGLRYLNAMFANWNADDLLLLPILVTGTWNSGIQTDFLGGTSAAFPGYTGPGPARVRGAYVTLNGRNIPLNIKTLEWYRSLAYPAIQATGPENLVYSISAGDSSSGGLLYVHPVPSGNVAMGVSFTLPYPILADATTGVQFDNMAVQPAIFNLAVEVGAAYGVNVSAETKKAAADGLARLRNYAASTWGADPNPQQGQSLQPPAQPTP